jgi:hypothetical protein
MITFRREENGDVTVTIEGEGEVRHHVETIPSYASSFSLAEKGVREKNQPMEDLGVKQLTRGRDQANEDLQRELRGLMSCHSQDGAEALKDAARSKAQYSRGLEYIDVLRDQLKGQASRPNTTKKQKMKTKKMKTLKINLNPPSPTVCPNCRDDKESALVDSIILIAKTLDTTCPQLCWCEHCRVFFCYQP